MFPIVFLLNGNIRAVSGALDVELLLCLLPRHFFFKYTRRRSSANLAQYHSVVGWHWRCCTAAAADGVLCEFEVSVGAAERIYMFDIRGVVTTNEQTMSLYMYAHSCKSLNIYLI